MCAPNGRLRQRPQGGAAQRRAGQDANSVASRADGLRTGSPLHAGYRKRSAQACGDVVISEPIYYWGSPATTAGRVLKSVVETDNSLPLMRLTVILLVVVSVSNNRNLNF